ncbi:hypothetical protein F2Q68_00034866 [Brassica cretica]|uniref:Uncharacterized protein n=1 Tax=Brassica cretica TaxID=69181 RepID=A0A8S9H499_BRACR|nr:hypothetical protein F2Q68_00034866 [Brassica cretica]
MIPRIKGRVWGHWAPTPVFPDSKEVGPAAPGGDGEVDQPLAPLGGWQSRTWTAGLARKGLLQGGIGTPFGKPAKLRASRDGSKAGWVENGMGRKRDGLNLRDFEDPQP